MLARVRVARKRLDTIQRSVNPHQIRFEPAIGCADDVAVIYDIPSYVKISRQNANITTERRNPLGHRKIAHDAQARVGHCRGRSDADRAVCRHDQARVGDVARRAREPKQVAGAAHLRDGDDGGVGELIAVTDGQTGQQRGGRLRGRREAHPDRARLEDRKHRCRVRAELRDGRVAVAGGVVHEQRRVAVGLADVQRRDLHGGPVARLEDRFKHGGRRRGRVVHGVQKRRIARHVRRVYRERHGRRVRRARRCVAKGHRGRHHGAQRVRGAVGDANIARKRRTRHLCAPQVHRAA